MMKTGFKNLSANDTKSTNEKHGRFDDVDHAHGVRSHIPAFSAPQY